MATTVDFVHAYTAVNNSGLVKLISDKVLLKMNYRYPIVSIPLSACIFVISFGVIRFMKKIPIVGKWLI